MRVGLLLSLFLFGVSAQAATGKTATVLGRAKVSGSRSAPQCEICVGCEGFSGGVKKKFDCGKAGRILDGLKYRIRLTPTIVDGKCQLRTEGAPELLAPEDRLPLYPNSRELEASLACGKEGA